MFLCALALWHLPSAAAPIILRQPTNQVALAEEDALFSVVVTGAPPFTYQWRKDTLNIARGTNADLIISNVQSNDAGKYVVTITDNGGAMMTSSQATLTVLYPVSIFAQPQSQTVSPGNTVQFTVGATGSSPLHCQWMFNGSMLAGATNQTLVLSNVTVTSAGYYSVRVWNGVNAVISDDAILTVTEQPTILSQPADQSVALGSSATFFVNAAGAQPLTYQWIFNGTVISGATGQSLTLTNVRPQDQGNYRVVVMNEFGSKMSEDGHLTVLLPELPFADDFTNSVVLSNVLYFAGHGTNIGATRELDEPIHDGKKAVRSVWISWTAPANGIVSINTRGSDFDTVLAVYAGDSLDTLTPIESDDDNDEPGSSGDDSKVTFNAVAGTTYRIAVAGYLFSEGNIVFELALTPTSEHLPMFLTQPQHYSVTYGADVGLSFDYASDTPVQIQWLFMGFPLANETRTSNNVTSIDDNRVGRYRARIITPTYTNYSRWAEIQINSRGISNVLAQDKLGGALDYGLLSPSGGTVHTPSKYTPKSGGSGSHGYTTTQIFSTIGSGFDPGEPYHCGVTNGGHSEWFAYQAEADGTLRIDTDGSSFDTVLAVYIGPGDSYTTLTNVACDRNSGSNGLTSKVIFTATQGTIYWIAVDGENNSSGTVHLNINLGNPVSISAQPQSQTAPTGSNAVFNVTANGMTNYIYQWRFGGTNLANATNATYTRTNLISAHAGNYDVVVRNPINSITSSVATLTVYSSTLNITNQPQSRTVILGTNVVFSVGVSGAAPVQYHWRCNSADIAGATNSSLLLVNVQATNAGTYAVNVTDANGSLLSSNATLTVLAVPLITLQPWSHTVASGSIATLTAAASGTPPPSFQWLFNGAPMPGAILSTLTITNFQSGNEGVYSMRASNNVGVATSTGAELLLDGPLRFTNSMWSNGVFSGRLIGIANTNYVIQRSTNLIQWSNLATNSSASGIWSFSIANTNSCWIFRAIAQ